METGSDQIDGLCCSDSISAIQRLMERPQQLRQGVLRDFQLSLGLSDNYSQLQITVPSTDTLSRAISAASNASGLSGTTLSTSPVTRTERPQLQAESSRNNRPHNDHLQQSTPNVSLLEGFSEGVNLPVLLLQHRGHAALNDTINGALNDPFSDAYAVDDTPLSRSLTPYNQPPLNRHLSNHGHERSPASALDEPHQESSLRNNTENPRMVVRSDEAVPTRQIKRKPVASNLRLKPTLTSASSSIRFNEERPQTGEAKEKPPQARCHLCSKTSKVFQTEKEFEKHLEADHARRFIYLCRHCPRFKTFRHSEQGKHHTTRHPTCPGRDVDQVLCHDQRVYASGYLSIQCPKCSTICGNYEEWLPHHLDHFFDSLGSFSNDVQTPVLYVTCTNNPKRGRGTRSKSSSPSSADNQPGHRHVNKSPRRSQEHTRYDEEESYVGPSKGRNKPLPNRPLENNDHVAENSLNFPSFDLKQNHRPTY